MTNVSPDGKSSGAISAFEKLVGRPRTVLALGDDVAGAVAAARACGAAVDAAAPQRSGYDLLLVGNALEGARDRAAVEARLARWAELLGDGGHALFTLPEGSAGGAWNRASAAALLAGVGLEALRVITQAPGYVRLAKSLHAIVSKTPAPAPLERPILVARKPPKPGKLSLTVGMLTMNEEESVEEMIDEIRASRPTPRSSASTAPPTRTARAGDGAPPGRPRAAAGPAARPRARRWSCSCTAPRSESDVLIYLDCDFTYPAKAIPRVRAPRRGGGRRRGEREPHRTTTRGDAHAELRRQPPLRGDWRRPLHGVPTSDVHSGMRGYRSSLIRAFDFDGEGDALPHRHAALPAKCDYHVVELPIPYDERAGVPKLARLRGTAWTFIRILGEVGEGSRVKSGSRYRHLDG